MRREQRHPEEFVVEIGRAFDDGYPVLRHTET